MSQTEAKGSKQEEEEKKKRRKKEGAVWSSQGVEKGTLGRERVGLGGEIKAGKGWWGVGGGGV